MSENPNSGHIADVFRKRIVELGLSVAQVNPTIVTCQWVLEGKPVSWYSPANKRLADALLETLDQAALGHGSLCPITRARVVTEALSILHADIHQRVERLPVATLLSATDPSVPPNFLPIESYPAGCPLTTPPKDSQPLSGCHRPLKGMWLAGGKTDA